MAGRDSTRSIAVVPSQPWSRTLGSTGLQVTAIGLGLAALGRPGYLNLGHGEDLGPERSVEALERRCHEVLDAAYDAGVRYFDAARSYGRAEEFLGSWLSRRGIAPGSVTVGSKWGYTYTANWQVDADPPEVKDLSVETFRRQLGETRSFLGDHLSLYQIHSATLSSGVLDDQDLREELAALRSSGVAIGFTTTGTEQAATIEHALEVGGFDTVQATWNLIERSAGEALQHAHDAGLGVIIKEALANGRLTKRGGPDAPGDAIALAGVRAQPFVDVALSGASTVEQLRSNLSAMEVEWTPQLDESLRGLIEPPDVYWENRSALAWT
jgi:aryl-alcohol dehydrogenase-like predicted oxidoreductase